MMNIGKVYGNMWEKLKENEIDGWRKRIFGFHLVLESLGLKPLKNLPNI